MAMKQERDARRPILVYAFDPLCGWCFAMRETIEAARSALGERVQWEVRCGGLVTGARERPIAEMAGYLARGMGEVEARSSARFGPGFVDGLLAEGRWISRSEPPCRAILVAARDRDHGAALDLGSELCRAFYEDGERVDEPEVIDRAASRVGLDGAALVAAWDTEEARRLSARAFAAARREGVNSYPAIFEARGGALAPLLPGFAAPAPAVAALERALGFS